jgi:membrane protein implicated in regulation of membrane protease activity
MYNKDTGNIYRKWGVIVLAVFQVCFVVGLGLIFLSFLMGNLLDALGIDGLDLDFDVFGLDIIIPIAPMLYILFVTIFGGIGWILTKQYPGLAILLITLLAIVIGGIICTLVYKLIIKPLKKAQNTSAPSEEELVGLPATINETITAGGFGQIRYIIHGNSFTAPAKSTTGVEIKAGQEVAICWIKEHVFYVVNINEM